jgi:hypothetical protein
MRNMVFGGMAAMMAAGVLALSGAGAGGKDKEVKDKEPTVDRAKIKASPDARAVSELATAYALVDIGRRTKSADALVVAARLIGTADTKEGKAEKTIDEPKKRERVSLRKEALALLDEAAKMTEDDDLRALIKTTRSQISDKGRPPGFGQPSEFPGVLAPREQRAIRVTVTPGLTRAFLRSEAGHDLDLKCIGALTGRQMFFDNGLDPNASGEFHSPLPGIFDFIVINYSDQPAPFRLFLN